MSAPPAPRPGPARPLLMQAHLFVDLLGIGPDRLYRHRHRQLFAVAIHDHATRRAADRGAQGTQIPLHPQPIRRHHLDPGGPGEQRHEGEQDHAADGQESASRPAWVLSWWSLAPCVSSLRHQFFLGRQPAGASSACPGPGLDPAVLHQGALLQQQVAPFDVQPVLLRHQIVLLGWSTAGPWVTTITARRRSQGNSASSTCHLCRNRSWPISLARLMRPRSRLTSPDAGPPAAPSCAPAFWPTSCRRRLERLADLFNLRPPANWASVKGQPGRHFGAFLLLADKVLDQPVFQGVEADHRQAATGCQHLAGHRPAPVSISSSSLLI
jgi:hypothetical protein